MNLPLRDSARILLSTGMDVVTALAPFYLLFLFLPVLKPVLRWLLIIIAGVVLFSAVSVFPQKAGVMTGTVSLAGMIAVALFWFNRYLKGGEPGLICKFSRMATGGIIVGGGYLADTFLSGQHQLTPVLAVAGLGWSAWITGEQDSGGGSIWTEITAPVLTLSALGGYLFLDYFWSLQGQPLWVMENHERVILSLAGLGALLYLPGRILTEKLGDHIQGLTMTPLEKAVSRWEQESGSIILPGDLEKLLEPFPGISFVLIHRHLNSCRYGRWGDEKSSGVLWQDLPFCQDQKAPEDAFIGDIADALAIPGPEEKSIFSVPVGNASPPAGILLFYTEGDAGSQHRTLSRIASLSVLPGSRDPGEQNRSFLTQKCDSSEELIRRMKDVIVKEIPSLDCQVEIMPGRGATPEHSLNENDHTQETNDNSYEITFDGSTFSGRIILKPRGDDFIFEQGDMDWLADLARQGTFVAEKIFLRQQVNAHVEALDRLRDQGDEAVRQKQLSLAGEIHDTIAQELFAARLQVNLITKLLGDAPPDAGEELKTLQYLMEKAQKDARCMISSLRSQGEGQAQEVSERIMELSERLKKQGVAPELRGMDILMDSPRDLQMVVVELLNNMIKHAQCRRCRVHVFKRDSSVGVFAVDDGVGFDQDNPGVGDSFGFQSIKNRCSRIGATVSIRSRIGKGSAFFILCPRI